MYESKGVKVSPAEDRCRSQSIGVKTTKEKEGGDQDQETRSTSHENVILEDTQMIWKHKKSTLTCFDSGDRSKQENTR